MLKTDILATIRGVPQQQREMFEADRTADRRWVPNKRFRKRLL